MISLRYDRLTRIEFSIFILSSMILFTGMAYAQTSPVHFDQPKVIIIEHTDTITYQDSTKAGNGIIDTIPDARLTITTAGVATSYPIMLTEESDDNGIFTSPLLNFTSTPQGQINKFLVSTGSNVEASVFGQTNSTTIKAVETSTEAIQMLPRKSEASVDTCEKLGLPDVDRDGICDNWEQGEYLVVTYPYSTTTPPYIFYCGLSNPCDNTKRDVFVEIDWMEGHRPNELAVQDVVNAFTRAPLSGADAVRVHVQMDPTDSSRIPHKKCIMWGSQGINPFDKIKAANFGTLQERTTHPQWYDVGYKEKRQAFHYVLFAHDRCTSLGQSMGESGTSEFTGNDVEVTLGRFAGSRDQQAGTLMHELGHNLGLRHGGADDIGCKPNYLSVMSYSRQFADLVPTRKLDYSRAVVGTLNPQSSTVDENRLNESAGIGNYVAQEEITYGPTPPYPRPTTGSTVIDWDQLAGSPSIYSFNITSIKVSADNWICKKSSLNPLVGFDDWRNIVVNVRNSYESLDGRSADGDASNGEITDSAIRTTINSIRTIVNNNPSINYRNEIIGNITLAENSLNPSPNSPQGDRYRAISVLTDLVRSAPDDMNQEIVNILWSLINHNGILDTSNEIVDKDVKIMRKARIDSIENFVSNKIKEEHSKLILVKTKKQAENKFAEKFTEIRNDMDRNLDYEASADLQSIYKDIADQLATFDEQESRTMFREAISDILKSHSISTNDPAITIALKSPKKQLTDGIEPQKVVCDLKKMLLKSTIVNSTICVTENTAQILKERGKYDYSVPQIQVFDINEQK